MSLNVQLVLSNKICKLWSHIVVDKNYFTGNFYKINCVPNMNSKKDLHFSTRN